MAQIHLQMVANEIVCYIPHGGIEKISVEMLEEDIGFRLYSPKQTTVAYRYSSMIEINSGGHLLLPPPEHQNASSTVTYLLII